MVRSLILAGVMTLGLALPATLPAPAQAQDFHGHAHHHHHCYEVLYRHDCHCRWHVYGVYHHRHEAQDAAHHLRHRGYEVSIAVRD